MGSKSQGTKGPEHHRLGLQSVSKSPPPTSPPPPHTRWPSGAHHCPFPELKPALPSSRKWGPPLPRAQEALGPWHSWQNGQAQVTQHGPRLVRGHESQITGLPFSRPCQPGRLMLAGSYRALGLGRWGKRGPDRSRSLGTLTASLPASQREVPRPQSQGPVSGLGPQGEGLDVL